MHHGMHLPNCFFRIFSLELHPTCRCTPAWSPRADFPHAPTWRGPRVRGARTRSAQERAHTETIPQRRSADGDILGLLEVGAARGDDGHVAGSCHLLAGTFSFSFTLKKFTLFFSGTRHTDVLPAGRRICRSPHGCACSKQLHRDWSDPERGQLATGAQQ